VTADKQDVPAIKDFLKQERERGERYWNPVHDIIDAARSYAEGNHFDTATDPNERRPEYLLITGQDTDNVLRHKSAQLTDSAQMVEARPVDEFSDPDDAELAASLIEAETGNPQKGYADAEDLMAMSAVAARIGIIWIDWDPDMGPWGEILFRPGDATKVMWEPGFHDPHDLSCGWIKEDRVLPLSRLKGMLKGNRWADKEALDGLQSDTIDAGARTSSGSASIETQESGRDIVEGSILVSLWWLKNDQTVKTVDLRSMIFKPEDRYMVCATLEAAGCGWRGMTQGEIGLELPPEEPGTDDLSPETGCPKCGGPLMRVDMRDRHQSVLVYPRGKRLVLECPNQGGAIVYDGPWPTMARNPHSDIRSFPLYVFTSYLPIDPTKPTGRSDTERCWSAQSACDYLVTKGFRAAAQYQRYYSMPKAGIEAFDGTRFEFRDDQFNVMFRNPEIAAGLGADALQVVPLEGSQFDPSLPAIYGMMQQTLNAKQGISDFGYQPGGLKDIPAATAALEKQVADIPAEHLKRRFHRCKSKGHGVVWDMIRSTYSRQRMQRLKLTNGVDEVVNVRGDELPNFDFVVGDVPNFSGLEKAKSEALDRLIAVPVEWQEVYAQVNNLPPSILRKVQKKQQEIAATSPLPGGGVAAQGDQAPVTGVPAPNGQTPPPGTNDPRRVVEAMVEQLPNMRQ
jgi:hypothetical protein